MEDTVYNVLFVLVGLLLGSFFNVLIWRVPRRESIVRPRSHCPSCGRTIRAVENIPVFSFVLLRGRCAGCGERISWLYPAVEILTAGATLTVWLLLLKPAVMQHAPLPLLVLRCVQSAALLLLIPMSIIDLQHLILPDAFTLPGLAISLGLAFMPGDITPVQSLVGLLVGGGTLLVFGKIGELVFRKGEGMGGGDIKLMAWVGALWGWQTAALTILIASFVGALVGLTLFLTRALPRDHRIPFGPFLAAGVWASALAGASLVGWYLSLTEGLLFG